MVLIGDKSKILSKCQYEILHIVNNGIFHHPFIHILFVTDTQFLHIDIVQQILILEGINGAESLLCRRYRLHEVIRQAALVMIETQKESCR